MFAYEFRTILSNRDNIPKHIIEVLNTDVEDVECKHTTGKPSNKLEKLLYWSEQVEYDWAIWGAHTGLKSYEEKYGHFPMSLFHKIIIRKQTPNIVVCSSGFDLGNYKEIISYRLARITNMLVNNFNRHVKIVRTTSGTIWADNTHTLIANYLRDKLLGGAQNLSNMNIYILDIQKLDYGNGEKGVDTKGKVIIWHHKDSIIPKLKDCDIQELIRKGIRLEAREQIKVRDFSWTIKDLLEELGIGDE
jgi:hypothetical protein